MNAMSPEMEKVVRAETEKAAADLKKEEQQAARRRKHKAKANGKTGNDASAGEVDVDLERLARLSTVDYERQRKLAAEKLGFRTSMLDLLVKAKRTELGLDEGKDLQGSAVTFPEPEPWPDPVAGDVLLSEIADAIRRYVVMEDHSRDLAALWVVHSYLLDSLMITPRLVLCSPTKQCGKTTTLDVLTHLVKRPLPTANVSTAAVFRVVQSHQPCLLIDEADTFLLGDNDGLRGILNSGHRRGGSVLRVVGDDLEPRAFSTYGACAIALIGNLPDTLADRSITVHLKRKLPKEQVTAFRLNRTSDLDELARRIARWAIDNAEAIRDADPKMPEGVGNRRADNLLPLLAIADRAGGEWPERARTAATAGREGVEEEARLELLLEDIRNIFIASDHLERIASATLVERLVEIEGRPWAEHGRAGKPITPNKLARLLAPLGISPEQIRFTADDSRKGYHQHQFTEAFERFLSQEGGFEPKHRNKCDEMGTSGTFQTETTDPDVSVRKSQKSNNDGLCCSVAVQKGEIGKEKGMPLDDAAAGTLAARYLSLAYHPDGRVKSLEQADADLRSQLALMVSPDRIEVEFQRMLNIIASETNPGPKPDRGPNREMHDDVEDQT
jgi:putative DNA primase/helicase